MFLSPPPPPHTHTHTHSHRHSIIMPASYRSLILGHSSLSTALPIQEESLQVSPIVPTGPQLQTPAELVKMELPNLQDKMNDRGMSVFLFIHPPLTCSSLPSHAPTSHQIATFIEEATCSVPPLVCLGGYLIILPMIKYLLLSPPHMHTHTQVLEQLKRVP